MTAEASTASWQAEYWNGPAGQRWAIHQDQVDRALEQFGKIVIERANLRIGNQVLDVGCGCGATTLLAAERISPGGRATGIDLSVAMIAKAKERARALEGLEFAVADASQYVGDGRFDALISRLGVMFFREPQRAFEHLRSLLEPGGSLTFTAWREFSENHWLSVAMAALRKVLPEVAQPGNSKEPGPFAFADPGYVRAVLESAGFQAVDIAPYDAPIVLSCTGLNDAVDFLSIHAGPVGRVLSECEPGIALRARKAIAEALSPFEKDGVVQLRGSSWLVSSVA